MNDARRAIEALRAGVPNRAAIRLLGTTESEIRERFLSNLNACQRHLGNGDPTTGQVIAGGFGAGKSHLLGYLQELALSEAGLQRHEVGAAEQDLLLQRGHAQAGALGRLRLVLARQLDRHQLVVVPRADDGSDEVVGDGGDGDRAGHALLRIEVEPASELGVAAPPLQHAVAADQLNLVEQQHPAAMAIGEITAAKSMRQYIKSWITSWDIERLYGIRSEIVAMGVTADYEEDIDIEHGVAPNDHDPDDQ
jgi:hypothetical protein